MVEEDRPSSKVGAVGLEKQYWTAVGAVQMDQRPVSVRRIYCFLGPWYQHEVAHPDQEGLAATCFVVIIDPLTVGEVIEKVRYS